MSGVDMGVELDVWGVSGIGGRASEAVGEMSGGWRWEVGRRVRDTMFRRVLSSGTCSFLPLILHLSPCIRHSLVVLQGPSGPGPRRQYRAVQGGTGRYRAVQGGG